MNLLKWLVREVMETRLGNDHPDREVQDGDEVVGELPEELKPLWVLYSRLSDTTSSKLVELSARINALSDGKKADSPEVKDLILKGDAALARHNFVKDAFWGSVKDAFPVLVRTGAGVCKGWKVVSLKPTPGLMLGLLTIG